MATSEFILWGRPKLPWYQNHSKGTTMKENDRSVIPDHRCKHPQQNMSKTNAATLRGFKHDQVGFIQGMQEWFNICQLINVILHINQMKYKSNIAIFINVLKALFKHCKQAQSYFSLECRTCCLKHTPSCGKFDGILKECAI